MSSKQAVISLKPYPISIEMRPLWRVALIVISIAVVEPNKKYLDLTKVNLWVWILIRGSKWGEYIRFLRDEDSSIPLVSVDAITYKAVEYAVSKGFISLSNGRLYLEESAERLFDILLENEVLGSEIQMLRDHGKKLTFDKIKKLTGGKY